MRCNEEFNGTIDAFTIQYNALIYALQHICGFKTTSFLVGDDSIISKKKGKLDKMDILNLWNNAMTRSIFILLHLP